MYDRVPFAEHLEALNWKPGEHLLIAGPTGSGKTTLAQQLVSKRKYAITFATKSKDPTLDREFNSDVWDKVERWKDIRPYMEKVIIWPKYEKTVRATIAKHKAVFGTALDAVMVSGNWCVFIDEAHYMTDRNFLGLFDEVAHLHHMGRSAKISALTLTQRPAWIPKIIYSSVTHAYIARTKDKDDLKRLADLGGIDPEEVRRNVTALPSKYDFVYLNPQGGASPVIVNVRR